MNNNISVPVVGYTNFHHHHHHDDDDEHQAAGAVKNRTPTPSRSRSRSTTERTSNKTVDKPNRNESSKSRHSNPTKSTHSPVSASASASSSAALPDRHVQTIHAAFCDSDCGVSTNISGDAAGGGGPSKKTAAGAAVVDLYRDVLRIDPSATDREIRIAYFKRGREILGETGFAAAAAAGRRKSSGSTATTSSKGGTTTTANNPSLDEQTQMKFQAISMAYEILSTPGWKEEFEDRIQKMDHHQLQKIQSTQTQTQMQPHEHLQKLASFHESTSPKSTVSIVTAGNNELEHQSQSQTQSQRQTLRQLIVQRRSKPGRMKPSPSIASSNSSGPDHSKSGLPAVPYCEPSSSVCEPKVLPSTSASASNISNSGADNDNDTGFIHEEDGEGLFDTAEAAAAQSNNNKNAVRWKDYVEEVVFDNHPNEHMVSDEDDDDDDDDVEDDDDEAETMQDDYDYIYDADGRQFVGNTEEVDRSTSMRSTASFNTSDDKSNEDSRRTDFSPSKRKKKQRRKIVIDSEELESHLNQMDSEAEQSGHFKRDFWDNFEESLDGILSMVDSFGEPVTARRNSARRRGRSTASLASSIESIEKASDVQSLSSSVAPCGGPSNDVTGSDCPMKVRDQYPLQRNFDLTQPVVQRASSFPRGSDSSHRHVEVGHVRSYEESSGPAVVSPDVKDGVNASKSSTVYTNSSLVSSTLSSKGTRDDSRATTYYPNTNPYISSPQSEITGGDDGTVVSTEDFTLASVTLSESDLPFHEHRPGKALSRISAERESSGHVRTLKRPVVVEESEDIFSGLDDFQNLDVATIPLRMSGAAVDRGLSAASSISDCLSDISESVFASSKPAKTVRMMSTKTADSGRPNIKSDATAATATTVESAVETNFFDHFATYVTALLTECETNGVSDSSFQKDLAGLFSTTGGSGDTMTRRGSESVATGSVVTEITESVTSAEC